VVDAKLVLEQLVLRLDHVPHGEARELHARLRLAVTGRGGQAVADGVRGHDEILGRVQRLAGADQEVEPMVIPGQRRDHQDGIRLLGVERAVRHVGDGEVLDDLSALQLEVTDLVELVGRIARTVGGNRARERADQQEAGDRGQGGMAHGRTSALRVHSERAECRPSPAPGQFASPYSWHAVAFPSIGRYLHGTKPPR